MSADELKRYATSHTHNRTCVPLRPCVGESSQAGPRGPVVSNMVSSMGFLQMLGEDFVQEVKKVFFCWLYRSKAVKRKNCFGKDKTEFRE